MTVCKECIEGKVRYKNSTLPCLELENAWASGRFPTAKEILCRAGRYHWYPKFCNVPDRVIEIKVCKEFSDVASKVRPIWFVKKV